MTIQQASQVTDPTQVAAASSTATKAASDPTAALANENTFLQLLVAQIKNQDPTNPTDSVQFLTQLAQFSQLEQLIGIRQELQPPASSTGTTPAAGTAATAGGAANGTANNATSNTTGSATDTTNQNGGTPSTAGTTN